MFIKIAWPAAETDHVYFSLYVSSTFLSLILFVLKRNIVAMTRVSRQQTQRAPQPQLRRWPFF